MPNLLLPETILLEVIWLCDVPTLKNLRLTNRLVCGLISTYETSTSRAITSRLLLSDDEMQQFRPLDGSARPMQVLFTLEYRSRVARWLSAVAAENHDSEDDGCFGNIKASDPRGDAIREHLSFGWSVMWHLRDIARAAMLERIPSHVPAHNTRLGCLTKGLDGVAELEKLILERQLEYAADLHLRFRQSYYGLHFCLQSVFHSRTLVHPRNTAIGCRAAAGYGMRHSWLNWLLLREGPALFAHAWASNPGNHDCAAYIEAEWLGRGDAQIGVERAAGAQLEQALLEEDGREIQHDLTYADLRQELTGWAERGGKDVGRVHTSVSFNLGYLLSRKDTNALEWACEYCEG